MQGSIAAFAEIGVYLAILFVTFYAIALGYHWFSYGASKKTAMLGLAAYLLGAALLLIAMTITLNYF